MAYTVGRLIDHIDIRSSDFAAARAFYRAVLTAIGRAVEIEEDGLLVVDELSVTRAEGAPTRGLHLCFQAEDRGMVDRFHAAGLAAGGRDNGAPGLRGYHPGYYAAFLLDPDGNNIEAKVDERVTARSAAAVLIETS